VSSITICYTEIPQPLWQFETLRLLCQSNSLSLFQLQASMPMLLIAFTNIFIPLEILRGSSPSLSIIPKCLRVLWLKPSVVSGSYTMSCYSCPPILFKFICTVGYAASKSGRPESVLPDLRSGLDSGAPLPFYL
jgi:hypothetical protein